MTDQPNHSVKSVQKADISVVIPAFNRADTIIHCLDSVLNQTFLPIEVIVVDDCSTDATAERVESLGNPLVKLIRHTTNKGAQAARNTGIRSAKGKWIAFQDSDDEWMDNKLEKQVEVLETIKYDPDSVIFTDCYVRKGRKQEVFHLPFTEGKEALALLLTRPAPAFQGMLTSKSALEKIAYLDEDVPAHQEWDSAIRLAAICRYHHIREPLFIWNASTRDSVSKNRTNQILGYAYIVNKFKPDILKIENGFSVWARHHYILCTRCLDYGRKDLLEKYRNELDPRSREYFDIQFCNRIHWKYAFYNKVNKTFWLFFETLYLVSRDGIKHTLMKAFRRITGRKRLVRDEQHVQIHPSSASISNFGLDLRNPKPGKVYLAIGENCKIDTTFIFERGEGFVEIGNHVFIGPGSVICADKIVFGDHISVSWNCVFYDNDGHSLDYRKRMDDRSNELELLYRGEKNRVLNKEWTGVESKPITVCSHVWIGMNVTILKGVTIGEGSVVAAGSVVTSDVEPWTVVGGNPAQILKRIPEELRAKQQE